MTRPPKWYEYTPPNTSFTSSFPSVLHLQTKKKENDHSVHACPVIPHLSNSFHQMPNLSSSWSKVAQGLRLVAQSSSKLALEEGNHVAAAVARHGVDLATNAKNAATQFSRTSSAAGKAVAMEHHNFGQNQNQHSSKMALPPTNDASEIKLDSKSSIQSMDKEKLEAAINEAEKSQHEQLYNFGKEEIISTSAVNQEKQEIQHLKEGSAVPSTRIGRAMGFASLGVGLAAGTAFEIATRMVSRVTDDTNNVDRGSAITNDANSDRLARTLCRMRGAALKLGQMMSIQDETLLAPPLAKALEQVRQGADAMPLFQLQAQMIKSFGEDWKDKFVSFDERPFAAASIGQVHRAQIMTTNTYGQQEEQRVVVKCQYPGVADSIDSDLNNLSMIVKMTGMTPPGLFIDNVIRVGRDELVLECNYLLEAQNQERFRKLVEEDSQLSQAKFKVPAVYNDLSSQNILTSEFCPGGTIDKVEHLDQEERNRIGKNILRLTMKELFVWRFMQTDPNWGNFLYDVGSETTYLIDFGSTREYSKSFVDGYLRIVWANANQDVDTLMSQSQKMGFLTGEENDIMMNAHKMSGFTIGEPFARYEKYDFAKSGITGRLSEHGSPFLQHRLTPPPEEVYTLHRKLAGAFNLCIRLGANIECRDLLEEIMQNHVFEDGEEHPLGK